MEHYILKAENVIAGRNLQTLWNAAVEVKDGKIAEIYETEAEIPEAVSYTHLLRNESGVECDRAGSILCISKLSNREDQ